MSNSVFVLLLVSSFLIVMFWETVRRYLFYVMKVCHNNGTGVACGCSHGLASCSSSSNFPEEEPRLRTRQGSCRREISCGKSSPTINSKPLDKMSYFFAFNDETAAIECNATPLQDVDPKDLA
ncbi:MAG: hypothetical protein LBT67_01965 [Holosporaceae bacterium]|jgi:hypothetical protein|nr:hypothetical protein [Holosporaceae bacterium]